MRWMYHEWTVKTQRFFLSYQNIWKLGVIQLVNSPIISSEIYGESLTNWQYHFTKPKIYEILDF